MEEQIHGAEPNPGFVDLIGKSAANTQNAAAGDRSASGIFEQHVHSHGDHFFALALKLQGCLETSPSLRCHFFVILILGTRIPPPGRVAGNLRQLVLYR